MTCYDFYKTLWLVQKYQKDKPLKNLVSLGAYTPFLVLQFSYYTLITFLIMLSVIFLSILMILLSILSVIRHLICDSNFNWLLILNLIYETRWTEARSGLLISMLAKRNWSHLTGLITLVLLMWKWMGLFLRKNHLSRCWGWPFLLN